MAGILPIRRETQNNQSINQRKEIFVVLLLVLFFCLKYSALVKAKMQDRMVLPTTILLRIKTDTKINIK